MSVFNPHFYILNRNGPGRVEVHTDRVTQEDGTDMYWVHDRENNVYRITREERSSYFQVGDIVMIGDSRYRYKVLEGPLPNCCYKLLRMDDQTTVETWCGRYFRINEAYGSPEEEASGLSPVGFHENDTFSSEEEDEGLPRAGINFSSCFVLVPVKDKEQFETLTKEKEDREIYHTWLKNKYPKIYKEYENMYMKYALTPK